MSQEFGHGTEDIGEQAIHEQAEALRSEIESWGQQSIDWVKERYLDPISKHAIRDHLWQAAQEHPMLAQMFSQYPDLVDYFVLQGSAFWLAMWQSKYEPV